MAHRYNHPETERTADLVDLSDDGDLYSSDDEPEQLGPYDRQLGKALKYLQQQGGEDSPPTFMDRVNRINATLLTQLPRQGHVFDPELYQQVRAMVVQYKRDFDNAVNGSLTQLEVDKGWSGSSTPTTSREALYRGDSESPTPTPEPASATAPREASHEIPARRHLGPLDDNVPRTHRFTYGGPRNELEEWARETPAVFPFGETLMMSHWEGLKVSYDLARGELAPDSGVVDTDVPFDHPQLQPYLKLSQYESGSPYKLPLVDERIQDVTSKYGTADRLSRVVEDVCKPYNIDKGSKHYAPRVFLEKFKVGHQDVPSVVTLSKLRNAMAGTPSKVPFTNKIKKPIPPSKKVTASTPSAGRVPSIRRASSIGRASNIGRAPATPPRSIRATVTPSSSSNIGRVPATWSGVANSQVRASPAFRRISREVRRAELEDRLASSSATSRTKQATAIPKPQTKNFATHVEVPKRGPGRPRKEEVSVETTPTPKAPASVLGKRSRGRPRKYPVSGETTPTPKTPHQSTPNKRKPSIGSRAYTTPPSALKKVLRDAKRPRTTASNVVSYADDPTDLEEDSDDPRYLSTPSTSPVVRSMTKKVSKASEAGAMVRRLSLKGVEQGNRRVTRSRMMRAS